MYEPMYIMCIHNLTHAQNIWKEIHQNIISKTMGSFDIFIIILLSPLIFYVHVYVFTFNIYLFIYLINPYPRAFFHCFLEREDGRQTMM